MEDKNSPAFENLVAIIEQSCAKNTYTDDACTALANLAPLLENNIGTDAYKKFGTLDLSHILQNKNLSQALQEKAWPESTYEPLRKVTFFELFRGKLARHNFSVTDDENEQSLFSNISDMDLDITNITKEQCVRITGIPAEISTDEYNKIAVVLKQVIALRNNKRKKEFNNIGCQELFRTTTTPVDTSTVTQTTQNITGNQVTTSPAENLTPPTMQTPTPPVSSIIEQTSPGATQPQITNHQDDQTPKTNTTSPQVENPEIQNPVKTIKKPAVYTPFYRKRLFIGMSFCAALILVLLYKANLLQYQFI